MLIMLASLITACVPNLNGLIRLPGQEQDPAPENLTLAAEVSFLLETPLMEGDQEIFVEIVDEITGLALNPSRYEMKEEAETVYSLKMPFTVGSVIKYRYLRMGETRAAEYTSQGEPVRYRMFHVSGPDLIAHDIVAAWNDRPYSGETGRLEGQVVDLETNHPVPNAMVLVGGDRTFTASDGSFLLDGLPPGGLNLVVYSLDGSYHPFQQGAIVASHATTQATVRLEKAQWVNVTFIVEPPADSTTGLPVRLIGNTYPLGNTFADLQGGFSTLASRAPLLTHQPDGKYSLTLQLPAGLDLQYKYSMGDGFWNAEQTALGHFRVRRMIVPASDVTIEDQIDAWTAGDIAPVTFTVKVPDNTPAGDIISIQFNPFAWTPPIPMWPLGNNEWVYILTSPLHMVDSVDYRYCRNDQCEGEVSSTTTGAGDFRFVRSSSGQTRQDTFDAWTLWQPENRGEVVVPGTSPRSGEFVAGVEIQTGYHPSWQPYWPAALGNIQNFGSNLVVFTPGWTYTDTSPVLEPVPGRDPLWTDLTQMFQQAQERGLQFAVYPRTIIAGDPSLFWSEVQNRGWWSLWFDRYSRFLLHHADLAEQSGGQSLILGEPGSLLAILDQSENAEERWRALLTEIRSRFNGDLLWAVQYPGGTEEIPIWIDEFDGLYLEWTAPLVERNDPTVEELTERFTHLITTDVLAYYEETQLPVILSLKIPSVDGAATGCIRFGEGCLAIDSLDQPFSSIDSVQLDLQEQADAYNAALSAIMTQDWITGFVSQGYYPPVAVQDFSASIHGKPAADVLWYWLPQFTGATQNESPIEEE